MVQVFFHGHSSVQLTSGEHSVIVDPFITDNPVGVTSIDTIKVSHILVSHGHGDHVGDAIDLARRNHATIVCNFELGYIFEQIAPDVKILDMHIGGSCVTLFGRVKMTIAHHGSGYEPDGLRYSGPPAGFLITIGGMTIYHAGDTGLFLDMKLIGELNKLDLACLPIGDKYTMGIDDAAHAVTFLKPRIVLPMHYNTFPPIQADVNEFVSLVHDRAPNVLVWPMKPGDTRSLTI